MTQLFRWPTWLDRSSWAEIAPARFSLIDGHHRVAKARRMLSSTIAAYRVRCPDHVSFLTSAHTYEEYVDYWNSKLP